jgi:hypothetical protein
VGRPADGPRLATKQLLAKLQQLEERPWIALGKAKKPMTDTQLATQLRDYNIRSGTIRVEGGGTAKGYYLRSFQDAFIRYLSSPTPTSPSPSRHTVTKPGKQGENEVFADVTNSACDGSENAGNPSNSGVCDDVTAGNDGNGGVENKSAVDEALADAVAALIPRSGQWVAAPGELLDGIGRGLGFPETGDELVAWLARSRALLAQHGVEAVFVPTDLGELVALARIAPARETI